MNMPHGILVGLLILTATTLAATLYLFVSVKAQMGRANKLLAQRLVALETEVEDLRRCVQQNTAEFRALEERTGMLVPPPPTRSGLNLTRRAQALRMLRRGDGAPQVAAALGLPRNEVALLVKIHELRSNTSMPEG